MGAANDYAKHFMKKGLDSYPNTYDGNMKLQKLLVFANLICIAQYDRPLFSDDILAFENGYVVEEVRQSYRNNYRVLKTESDNFVANFTEAEEDILQCVEDIYGNLSARDLSHLSHQFNFWTVAYNRGKLPNGYHDKELSKISYEDMKKEIPYIRKVLTAYRQNKLTDNCYEVVNGIKYYYNPNDFEMNEEVLDYLYDFSKDADDTSYRIYYDEGVIIVL